MPTISISSLPSTWFPRWRPTASGPRLNFFRNASLTIATFGVPLSSVWANSRPASTRIPSVRKYSGPTRLSRELTSVSRPARILRPPHCCCCSIRRAAARSSRPPTTRRPVSKGRFQVLEKLARVLGLIAIEARGHAEDHHVLRIQAEVDAADVDEALREETSRHEERHRQSDL